MLEVYNELWCATSYIKFESLKIIIYFVGNFKVKKYKKHQGVNFNIYFCDQEEYVTSPFGVKTLNCTKGTKIRIFH